MPGPATALRGVKKVPPGHVLVWEDGAITVERYWTLEPRPVERTDEEWLERVRATVGAAVRRRLVADVPLGALLSGGIDSSIVVALMAQASAEPVRTFTVGFPDARYDEREYARAVAERYGTRHEELEVELDAAELLPRLAWAFDEPFGDEAALPTLLVSRARARARDRRARRRRRRRGVRRLRALRAHGLAAALAARAGAAAARRAGAAGAPVGPLGAALAGLPRGPPADVAAAGAGERYARLMEVFSPELRGRLWTDEARPTLYEPPAPAGSGIGALQRLDIETYLPGDLLLKADLASMAHSLELRSPFLDHEVVELGLSLPDRLQAEGDAGQGRPAAGVRRRPAARVAARGKTGFGVPLGRWFREDLRELAADLLLDRRARDRGHFRPAEAKRLLPSTSPASRPRAPALVPADARALAAHLRRVGGPPASALARASSRSPSTEVSRTRAYALVAAVCALPRLVVVAVERGEILLAFTEKSDDFARTLVASGTFGFIPGEPSAYTQPLYGFFLAPLYWVVRAALARGRARADARRGRDGAARLRDRATDRVAAGGDRGRGVSTLHPYLVWHDVHVNREILDTLLAAALVLATLVAADRLVLFQHKPSPSDGAAPIGGELVLEAHKAFRRRAWLWGAILGALLGLAILGNSRLVLLPLVIVGYLAWRLGSARTILTLGAAGAAGIVLVLAPWVVRNDVSVGCYAITTDARALWKANNPSDVRHPRGGGVDRRRPEHPRRAAHARGPGGDLRRPGRARSRSTSARRCASTAGS